MSLKSIEIVIYLSAIIEVYAWLFLCKSLFIKKYNMSNIISGVIFFICITLKSIVIDKSDNVDFLAFVILMLYMVKILSTVLLYKDNIVKKMLFLLTFILISTFYKIIITIFFIMILGVKLEQLNTISIENLSALIFSKIIILFTIKLFIKRKWYDYILKSYYKIEFLIMFGLNFILIIFATLIYSSENIYIYNLYRIFSIIIIGLVILLITTIILLIKDTKELKKNFDKDLKIYKLELDNDYNKNISDVMNKLKSLKHDINNHIGILYGLIYTKQYDDLQKYIDKVYKDIDAVNDFVLTENSALSILLTNKKKIVRQKGIIFDVQLMAKNIPMEDFDIIIVLGNILDNAIEATENVFTDSYIELNICNIDNKCSITCKNLYYEEPVLDNNILKSTKSKCNGHGIGLRNIKNTVEKYNGSMEISYKNNIFCISILLPIDAKLNV